jgi:hypothetical protein
MPPKGYRHLSLREEVFKRLEEFAKSRGLSSLSDAVALLLDYADIYSKLEHLLQARVYTPDKSSSGLPQAGVVTPSESKPDLPQTGVATPDKSSSETANTANPSTAPSTAQGNTVVKCYEKSKMRYPVESNIAYFKSRGALVDWWEEGEDRVCFELKTGAESSSDSGQHRKKLYRMRYEDGDESWLLQYAPEDWEKE